MNAGTKELDEWSEGGSAPPLAPRGEYVNSTTLKRDANGNALGGIRLPDMSVPTGVNRGDNTTAPPPNPYNASAFCTLLGQYKAFSAETLSSLYTDYGDYVNKVKSAAEAKMAEGFLLPEDVTRIVESAEEFPSLRPTVPVLTGSSKNTGSFQLGWRGAVPSHPTSEVANTVSTKPTAELQHRNAAGEWTTVGGELSSPSFSFAKEQEGTWSYRVRSKTVVPAYKIEPEATIVTPWSDTLSNVVVDRTAPEAPSATADRSPDYAGGGGWFKDSVKVSFSANGDPLLADGSPGSGVAGGTLSSPVVFNTNGAHEASGTVADNVGNVSAAGTLSVQVDATAPSVEVTCPAKVVVGESASATVTASDGESGLAADPSGTVVLNTSKAGVQITSATATDNVGHETTGNCTTNVGLASPSAPVVSAGSNPSNTGLFTLLWTGTDPGASPTVTYTLQHHNAASAEWTTVGTEIVALEYAFTGFGEAEGTWVYRVQGHDSASGETTAFSPSSTAVVVDKTAPSAPSAAADRAPDYAGGGGWFKDSVKVSFSSNGDPALADGSAGSGVNGATLSSPVVFNTSGSHEASGTVADNAGNVSTPGTLTAKVDATAPSVEVNCPTNVAIGGSASATVTASDGQSGLSRDPSATVAISTVKAGGQTVMRTAIDNVGHETTAACTTIVGYTQVITGNVKGKLTVKSGQAIELSSTAKVSGGVTVKPGGALDVEGATISGALSAKGATVVRVCGAKIAGTLKVSGSSGSVTIGEGNAECAANTIHGAVTIKANSAGVEVIGNSIGSSLKVMGNSAGVAVTGNSIEGNLTVTGNTGSVTDKPNEVEGVSKVQ